MTLAILNLVLFVSGLVVLFPKNTWKKPLSEYPKILAYHSVYLGLIILVVLVHLLEVNILDAVITDMLGMNFTSSILFIEDGIVHWFSQQWTPVLVYFFVFVYIGLYPFLLWFTVLYFIIVDERKAIRTFTYALIWIYAIALPFYLFFPITNVYSYYGTPSALNTVIPSIEHVFYTTTTNNNCFPSLHVAMSLLLVKTVSLTKNKRIIYVTYFCAICVICSVIYLAIHWITDVIGGILLALGVFYLVQHFMKET
ncbi:MAG: inositol phosphorylceramide synthase [Candidatus Thermoplasmatota archaeon]|nr:inositol phosphorylceramide synthase [Candidatus Thermoplasmatota archaeon]